MPVQYPTGILAEHAHTRSAAGLFDVSHMGQVRLTAKPGRNMAPALETLVPADIAGLQAGQQRHTQFTDQHGGILDDLLVTSTRDHLLLVLNAASTDADLARPDHQPPRRARPPRPPRRGAASLGGDRGGGGPPRPGARGGCHGGSAPGPAACAGARPFPSRDWPPPGAAATGSRRPPMPPR